MGFISSRFAFIFLGWVVLGCFRCVDTLILCIRMGLNLFGKRKQIAKVVNGF